MLKRFFVRSSPFTLSPAWTLFSYTILIGWALITLFPFYWLVVTTFKLPIDVNAGPTYIPWGDYKPSTHAFDELLFSDVAGNFVTRPYLNTVVVAVNSALLALLFGSMAAYALSRFQYRPKPGLVATFALSLLLIPILYSYGVAWWWGLVIALCLFGMVAQTIGRRFKGSLENNDIAFWLVSQRMLPPVAVILPIYIMYSEVGMLNNRLGLIIAYTAIHIPLAVWFMRDYVQSIPIELEESAFIDGASRYGVLFRIILPLTVPGLIATFIIILIFAWNEYTMALFLTGADTQTMPILVAAQNATRGPQWWNISLLVLMMVAPIVLMSILLERFIARGILLGAVKG